jgi:hypothetical protein
MSISEFWRCDSWPIPKVFLMLGFPSSDKIH